MRVAAYYRVSTARQAEKDLSIPDQRRQARAYCEAKGWALVEEYEEPGASGTDDRRPAFQRMIERALEPQRPLDVILVHSLSRFFRDAVSSGLYQRRLERNKVQLVSITQDVGNDATGRMVKHIIAAVDELSSAENAKHTLRGMKENARQGFWNGSWPPYGYRAVEVERRGDKIKKRLEIDPQEAETVRLIFRLYEHGDRGNSLGVKAIAAHLNAKGIRYRGGRRFHTGLVHRLLTRPTYKGEHVFNRKDSKTGEAKPPSEWITVPVPAVIPPAAFDRVQALLKSRQPQRVPPRVVNGPTLLTGLAKCATCGGGMTLRTGKSGRYRYYTCSTCARLGKTACKGRSIRLDLLDGLVLSHLSQRIFTAERLKTLLGEAIKRAEETRQGSRLRLKAMRRELRETELALERLYGLVEKGIAQLDETLRQRIATLQQGRDDQLRAIAMAERRVSTPIEAITSRKLEAFAAAVRAQLNDPESAFRKSYLRLFVDRIEVDDAEVRIYGPRSALARALEAQQISADGPVPSFVPEWRPHGDSNPGLRRERPPSWASRRWGRAEGRYSGRCRGFIVPATP